ncbi:DUF3817 domain-containing protein [Metabacillus fastidiosus]|uniref:DUF3817 domain-containing protein n=1 Tax=Metabacillus fastidiosus TaxID=1458 RepID=UPI002DBCF97F|nr:DUF3817 domain-containing protein [Metabacillus fastidiosus]MEC2076670.1 DUF3817 domain-containing protein [Metabacillus fastidiosus]
MLKTAIGKFRFMGFVEGISLLVLLFIAMPLKYGMDIPQAVTIVGALHGIFFILYIFAILYATMKVNWAVKWGISAVAVAFVPFGNFIFDYYLKKSPYIKE